MKVKQKNPKTYEVHNDFKMKIPPTETLIETLDKSLRETYQIRNGGKLFQESFEDTYLFMKLLKYDPYGIKKITFDILDPILKGTSSFSYHREIEDPIEFIYESLRYLFELHLKLLLFLLVLVHHFVPLNVLLSYLMP